MSNKFVFYTVIADIQNLNLYVTEWEKVGDIFPLIFKLVFSTLDEETLSFRSILYFWTTRGLYVEKRSWFGSVFEKTPLKLRMTNDEFPVINLSKLWTNIRFATVLGILLEFFFAQTRRGKVETNPKSNCSWLTASYCQVSCVAVAIHTHSWLYSVSLSGDSHCD